MTFTGFIGVGDTEMTGGDAKAVMDAPGFSDPESKWVWFAYFNESNGRPNDEQAWAWSRIYSGFPRDVTVSARLDGHGDVYLNGTLLGSPVDYNTTYVWPATLAVGWNVIAANAANPGDVVVGANPAGILIVVRDATTSQVLSRTNEDTGWWASSTEPADWPTP